MTDTTGNNSAIRSIRVGADGYWQLNGQRINLIQKIQELTNTGRLYTQETVPLEFRVGDKWFDTKTGILSEAKIINDEFIMWVESTSDNDSMPLAVLQNAFVKIATILSKMSDGMHGEITK